MLTDFLKLDRPLIGLDCETHAFVQPEESHICELGFKVLYPDGRTPKTHVTYVKPPVPITEEATEKHHITNEMVKDAPMWKDLANNIAHGFSGCDFCGYHLRFDLRVIYAEMVRVGVAWSYAAARLVDGLAMWRVAVPRTLTDAVKEFCGRTPTEAHRALGDAEDAMDVADGMFSRFKILPRNLDALHQLCFADPTKLDPDGKFIWKGKDAAINFGKHSGTLLRNVPQSYLQWIAGSSFPSEVKAIVNDALTGKYPTREK